MTPLCAGADLGILREGWGGGGGVGGGSGPEFFEGGGGSRVQVRGNFLRGGGG